MSRQANFDFPKKGVFIIPLLIFLFIFLIKSTETIKSGEAGVVWRFFGGVDPDQEPLGEGFHIIAPWNNVYVYNVKQQSISDVMKVLSVNGLEVTVNGTVWFKPEFKNLGYLHKTRGRDYIRDILDPAINAAARSVVGRYTPEQLYSSKRDVIEKEILEEVSKELEDQYIKVNKVLVEDVQLPKTIKEAIERKLKQEQEALEYEFRLAKAKKEAERQRIDAEGKAAANKILSASLTDKILQEKGIEATLKLSESSNSKVVLIGSGKSGMPIILGNQ
ncbi:peptidase [Tenacibaculum sp. SZ-18]|uniref:prohibitin family protein n=1 Tax=Tenacibaculum sp. SZ-18 TaxID=754423 RepID=UPI000C2D3EE6|nr:prohibitin family protein [Tenacibaculum sp. SZ-18]AUC15127.1 peptidase [Tenacibaculum sp. SZ-18]